MKLIALVASSAAISMNAQANTEFGYHYDDVGEIAQKMLDDPKNKNTWAAKVMEKCGGMDA